MSAARVLLQLDCDPQPSAFDGIVAIDAGVDVLLRHGGVTPESAVALVHGAMFTRGEDDLASTAIFVGGSDVRAAEAIFEKVRQTFLGPLRVSVFLDPAGANTTACAAAVVATRHLPCSDRALAGQWQALVLGGTGPVGQRVAQLLARTGMRVAVASRSRVRAAEICQRIMNQVPQALLEPVEPGIFLAQAIARADLIVAAGAAGTTLLDGSAVARAKKAQVMIDLNAVPPAGIEGIIATDKAQQRHDRIVYGAFGVGGIKMRIHRTAIHKLFQSNKACLDVEELYAIGTEL